MSMHSAGIVPPSCTFFHPQRLHGPLPGLDSVPALHWLCEFGYLGCIPARPIYIYIYILSSTARQFRCITTLQCGWSWDRNPADSNANPRFYHSVTRKLAQAKEICIRIWYFRFLFHILVLYSCFRLHGDTVKQEKETTQAIPCFMGRTIKS